MTRRHTGLALALAGVLTGGCASATPPPPTSLAPVAADPTIDPRELFAPARTTLLILGVFHFANPGLDSHKSEHPREVVSERRQAELAVLLDQLAAFEPTKIAVEVLPRHGAWLDAQYREYRSTKRAAGPNEVYQLGFALADRLGHAHVFPVDARGRRYRPYIDPSRAAARWGQQARVNSELAARYERYYDWQDSLYEQMSLSEYLAFINSPEILRLSHGPYVSGDIAVHNERSYPAADHVSGWWYDRNLRIFANVASLTEQRDERILLVIGAGHVPILQHAALASPDIELVEVADVLCEVPRSRTD